MKVAWVRAILALAVAGPVRASAAMPPPSTRTQPVRIRQRAQIVGQGTTISAAISDARANAAKVAGSLGFRIISQRTTGQGQNWTCYLIIEYEVEQK